MTISILNDKEFETEVSSGQMLLVDLRADWCPQCGPQENVLLRIYGEYEGKVRFTSVDVGLYPEAAERYDVISLPTMLLFKNAHLQETLTGFKTAPLIRLALNKLINQN